MTYLGELLTKGVGDVVRGIGGYDEHRLADFSQLHGNAATTSCLANAALPAHEDPPQ